MRAMTSTTPQTPFVVSVVFSDGKTQYHDLVWIAATDIVTAGAAATGAYYFNGGKLPLYSIRVGCIDEGNARKAVAIYDFIRDEEKAEAEAEANKVARLVPRIADVPYDPKGCDHEPFPPAG